jgi:hypothetical protein
MTKIKDKKTNKDKKKKPSTNHDAIEVLLNTEGLASILLTPKEIDLVKDLIYFRMIDLKDDAVVFDDGDEWKEPIMNQHLKGKIQELNNIYSKLLFEI